MNSTRRRLPSGHGHGHGQRGVAARRFLWLAMGSIITLAVFSMFMLGASPALRGGLRSTAMSFPGGVGGPQPPRDAQPSDPKTAADEKAARELASQRARVSAVADSLLRISQQTTHARGIVLPLYDNIATLGISLILELRDMGVDVPIEVPHCGDLDEQLRTKLQEHDANVRVYDVCLEASTYAIRRKADQKLFCRDLNECHHRFRSFDIKLIALLLSRFDEVMMLDADTLFFQNPMSVWHSPKYEETGTLFFHDRVSCDHQYLAQRRKHGITHLEEYLSGFDPVPFAQLDIVRRPSKSSATSIKPPTKKAYVSYEPSEWFRESHSWNRRAGHQADSSLMLWNKKRQPRATAILGSFIAHGGIGRPPSYGDKEFYFMACELAGSAYAFSDFGTGAIGTDVRNPVSKGDAVLCGHALHYIPDDKGASDPATLYINSDRILEYKTSDDLYRSKARPAALYPGKIEDRGHAQECPFDISVEKLTSLEKKLITRRQEFHEIALSWRPLSESPAATTAAP